MSFLSAETARALAELMGLDALHGRRLRRRDGCTRRSSGSGHPLARRSPRGRPGIARSGARGDRRR
ncbi:hypothetical protein ACFSEO_00345, partial [Agromyces cerinus subsp. nitratus]|uniref:hypothetical protein n=1 Tax=Agromyces cerinus TaxID=33878 RepID=UPI003630385F